MSKHTMPRRITGTVAFVLAILPHRVWEWGWELVRAQLGEAGLRWLEIHFSFGLVEEYSGVLWRAVLILAAVWLWWPTIRERVPFFAPRLVSLDDATQMAYEAAEREGVLELIETARMSDVTKMEHLTYVLLTLDNLKWYGVRKPSKQLLPIPPEVVNDHLYPTQVQPNSLSAMFGQKPTYTDVAIGRRELRVALKEYLRKVKGVRDAD